MRFFRKIVKLGWHFDKSPIAQVMQGQVDGTTAIVFGPSFGVRNIFFLGTEGCGLPKFFGNAPRAVGILNR